MRGWLRGRVGCGVVGPRVGILHARRRGRTGERATTVMRKKTRNGAICRQGGRESRQADEGSRSCVPRPVPVPVRVKGDPGTPGTWPQDTVPTIDVVYVVCPSYVHQSTTTLKAESKVSKVKGAPI